MNNIAEGFEQDGNKELLHDLWTSKASAGENRSQLYGALDFGLRAENEYTQLNRR